MDFPVSVIGQSALGGRSCFYVGGRYTGEGSDHYMSGQMFVELYVPREIRHPYPVVFFHGAGQTNMNWLITPDGRMGWADCFVREGYAVYLAEQPARGRSAWHPSDGTTTHHPIEVIRNRFTTDEGSWPQAASHTQWPGDGTDMEDPVFRQLASSQVEYLPSNAQSQALVLEAGRELLKKIGPAILLTHSQAGPFGWLLADDSPDSVRGIVALEPTSPPFSRDTTTPVAHDYGLASLPLHYDPPVSSPQQLRLSLLPSPAPGLRDGWVLEEPAPQLPRLAGIPVLLVTTEASYHAECDHLVSHVLTQCGVEHTFMRLEREGIRGNGHMMMLEKNSLDIASRLIEWLTDRGL